MAADDQPGEVTAQFERNLSFFLRSFGLLQPGETPCGQPMPASQAHAITVIDASPGISQQALATTLGLARATTSELVTELANKGWVRRESDDSDRRVQRLNLTPGGREAALSISKSRYALLGRILEEVDPAERSTAIELIGRLAEAAQRVRLSSF